MSMFTTCISLNITQTTPTDKLHLHITQTYKQRPLKSFAFAVKNFTMPNFLPL